MYMHKKLFSSYDFLASINENIKTIANVVIVFDACTYMQVKCYDKIIIFLPNSSLNSLAIRQRECSTQSDSSNFFENKRFTGKLFEQYKNVSGLITYVGR